MRLRRYHDADEFTDRVMEYLTAHEAEHNLLLGILAALSESEGPYADVDPYLALVEHDAGAALVAIRTPPRNLVLSSATDVAALEPLLDDVVVAADVPGVTGPKDLAGAFAGEWTRRTGQESAVHFSMRVFEAGHAHPPEGVAGQLRGASADDRATAMRWMRAFELEALGEQELDAEQLERWADRMLGWHSDRGLVFWEVGGQVVSMAAYGAPTPTGIRVSAVYTPPERRGRGFATACVAALTQKLLEGARRSCFLFTDLSNPTSNAIYARIGYRPVVDIDDYRFGARALDPAEV